MFSGTSWFKQHLNQVNSVCVMPFDVRGALYPYVANGKHSKIFGYIENYHKPKLMVTEKALVLVYLNSIKTFGQLKRCE